MLVVAIVNVDRLLATAGCVVRTGVVDVVVVIEVAVVDEAALVDVPAVLVVVPNDVAVGAVDGKGAWTATCCPAGGLLPVMASKSNALIDMAAKA